MCPLLQRGMSADSVTHRQQYCVGSISGAWRESFQIKYKTPRVVGKAAPVSQHINQRTVAHTTTESGIKELGLNEMVQEARSGNSAALPPS